MLRMIASPCINVCRMDEASGLCLGCFRTLDEIAGWGTASEDEQRRILQAVAERRRSGPCPGPRPEAADVAGRARSCKG